MVDIDNRCNEDCIGFLLREKEGAEILKEMSDNTGPERTGADIQKSKKQSINRD